MEAIALDARTDNGFIDPTPEEIDRVARALYDDCHPNDSFDDMLGRARFTKEDKGLLRDWRAAAAAMIGRERLMP